MRAPTTKSPYTCLPKERFAPQRRAERNFALVSVQALQLTGILREGFSQLR